MAGALQQSPIAFRAKLPPTTRFTTKSILRKSMSLRSSFSGIKFAVNLSTKRSLRGRGGGGGAAGSTMVDSPATSYAGALADVAKSNGTLEATCADVEKVEQIFSNPLIVGFFTDPTTSVEKKREILDEIVESAKIQAHTANFLNILVDMKRIDILDEIVKQFEVVYNKMTNTELAIVTSVVKLDSKHLAQIAQGVQRLTGAENVRIKTVIDPSLVAGFTIRYGSSSSKLIDMSVKKQLDEIASQIDFTEMVGSLAG